MFVGTMVSPARVHTKPDGTEIRTMLGELAWQIGRADGYARVAEADRSGRPDTDGFAELLAEAGPTLILIDEWIAYARLLPTGDEDRLPAGNFGEHLTMAQGLATAVRAVPNALLVGSLPQSAIELGGESGLSPS